MFAYHYLIYFLLFAGMVLSIISKKLTVTGSITGVIVGVLVYAGAGYTGIAMLALFFIAGSVATNWRADKKQQLGIAEANKGRRTAGQVLSNGGVAAALGGLSLLQPQSALVLQLMMAGSLAAATADTLASELGSVYGRKFYDIINFKRSHAGPDGVVSLEGTLFGIGGAIIIALTFAIGFGFNYLVGIIIAAGAIGNWFDSIMGATLERKKYIGNNLVNFFNTSIGALVCIALWFLFK